MLEYNISLNNGSEALGTTGKTLTVNEQPRNISLDFLAEEMHHANGLIPKRTIREVLGSFADVAARLMAEGFAIQFTNPEGEVMMRLYADMHVKGGNINLDRAKKLDETVTDITLENASSLVQKAGITVRAYAEVEQKFTDLLLSHKPQVQLRDVKNVAYIPKKDSTQQGGNNNGGNTNTGGGNTNNGDGGLIGD